MGISPAIFTAPDGVFVYPQGAWGDRPRIPNPPQTLARLRFKVFEILLTPIKGQKERVYNLQKRKPP